MRRWDNVFNRFSSNIHKRMDALKLEKKHEIDTQQMENTGTET